MEKEPVILLGFGGNAIDFFDTIESCYDIIGFVDDEEDKQGLAYNGVKVYDRSFMEENHQVKVISLIGSAQTYTRRREILQAFHIPRERFARAVHPGATIGKNACLGFDVLVMPGAVITSNAKIGNHVFVMANTVIHHDVVVGDYSMIGANVVIAGHTKIGNSCYIGSGCNIMNGITLGENTLVGLGSNVLKSAPAHAKMVGNPARNLHAPDPAMRAGILGAKGECP